MTALYRTFLLLSVSMASLEAQRSVRSKRSLLELASIIKCTTGRSALFYLMYGCYCGLGGRGWPRDKADCLCTFMCSGGFGRRWWDIRFQCYQATVSIFQDVLLCCHKHDCCYGDAEVAGCQTTTDKYQWTCEDKEADCDSLKDRCEKILCQCDKEAGMCLRKAPYNKKYAFWPDIMCGHVYPNCNIY